ncbi:hypothetical protein INS49_009573 [Diaporthe citri]|uniref:uncharacterized protein n=1 Tax=Diaporthe citri TaxID=83186 RepID=UPI001C8131B7|nr:uncharacterized protein INS49_009573 [Diaporthe citri]KAG6361348.1 hypothetical protein INS49_009573 [Diaporthe citri]
MRLDTYEKRKSSLAKHLDYEHWTPGPYISFTSSPAVIQGYVMKRSGRSRGPHTLTVIDPSKRISMGLPILDVLAEMQSYRIPDPYGRGNQYCFGEHVCLWQVIEAEIVGHFPWDYLEQKDNWYQDIILPAFREFTEQHRVRPAQGSIDDLLRVGHDDSQSSDTGSADGNQNYYSDIEEDADFVEGLKCRYPDGEYDWDTDEDVEEASAADDMIKIIEGDWR